MANIVAIVGRPNVGKSTLFNRLVESRQAIMHDESGVTRDRHYGQGEWQNHFFSVIDTGGYVVGSEDVFEKAIREQVEIALEEASVVLFMVDCQAGITPLDEEFANVLRRSAKPVLLVANKADNHHLLQAAHEFYNLGFAAEIFAISSQSGSGTGELLDKVITYFEDNGIENPHEGLPRITILGRPNVGKSSFLNVLLGRERAIVSDIAGTTRDSIDTEYNFFGKNFIITDTAGIRRKARVKENIEFYSVMRSIKALEDADVCIMMIDATQGLEAQDMSLIRLAISRKKGLILMVNKWDMLEKDSNTAHRYTEILKERLAPADYIPVVFTSVIEKQRVFQVMERAVEIAEKRKTRFATSALNAKILPEIERNPPPSHRGHHINIKYITQLNGNYPIFALFSNHSKHIKESYRRFVENKIREHFGLEGVPMSLVFKEK
ncbi:ribosome biogenesis GTPase Der [Hugenholtzia roseola]|uniref:ribosome biogenesis GTPase Der n=1 Tax=Hugenholtzia roseola TaxID=1002 RepID=UPI0004796FAB|nr:ribosome biogenesis GTPase Der [Hugenholtzia roseola]